MQRVRGIQLSIENVARNLALFVVVSSVWLLAGAEGWIAVLLSILAVCSAILWCVSQLWDGCPKMVAPDSMLTCVLFLILIGLTVIPLPARVVQSINPLAVRQLEGLDQVSDGLRTASDGSSNEVTPPVFDRFSGDRLSLSLTPVVSKRALLRFLAYASILLVLANTINDWRQLQNVCMVLLASGFLLAVIGIIHRLSGSRDLLWFYPLRYGGAAFGPFTNRNHYAAYQSMIVGVGIAALLVAGSWGAHEGEPWRSRLERFSQKRLSFIGLSAFAIVLIASSVLLTLSRAGTISLLMAALTIFILAFIRERKTLVNVLNKPDSISLNTALFITIGIMAMVVWIGWRPVVSRISTLRDVTANPFEDTRFVVSREMLRAGLRHPFVGTGTGSFRHVFPLSQPAFLGNWRFLHGHNDWFELFMESGFAGLFIVFFMLFTLLRRMKVLLFRSGLPAETFMGYGLFFAFITIGLHSFLDYGLRKPAGMYLFCAVCAMVLAVYDMRLRHGRHSPLMMVDQNHERNHSHLLRKLFVSGWLIAGVVSLPLMTEVLSGELGYMRVLYFARGAERNYHNRERLNTMIAEAADEVYHSGMALQGNPDAALETAGNLIRWAGSGSIEHDLRERCLMLGFMLTRGVVQQVPTDYMGWLWLARSYAMLGMWDAAAICLEQSRMRVTEDREIRMFNPVSQRQFSGSIFY